MNSAIAKHKNAQKNGSAHFKFGGIEIDVLELASRGNAVLGIRDSGKTYTATALAEKLMSNGVPIIVFDPVGVWRFLRVPGAGKGYPVVVAGGVAGDLPLTVATAPDVVRAAMKAGVSLVIDLFSKDFSKMDWKRIVTDCVQVLIYENQDFGLRHVILEEAAEFVPQRVSRDTAKVYSAIEKLARVGGNSRLGYTLINQRPEEVNKAVLELCDNLFLHRQKGRNTLKSLSKWLDVGNVDQIKPVMESMSSLPSGECWVWLKDHDEVKRIKVPQKNSMHPDRRVMHGGKSAIAKKAVDVGTFVSDMKKILEKPEAKKTKAAAAQPAKGKAVFDFDKIKTQEQVDEAHARGLEEGKRIGFDEAVRQAKDAAEAERAGLRIGVNDILGAYDAIRTQVPILTKAIDAVIKRLGSPPKTNFKIAIEKRGRIAPPPKSRPAITAPADGAGGDESLTGPQRAMLRALAWWLHMGKEQPTRVQIAVICKWKTTGSNVKDRISELFRMGLISKPTTETVSLTPEGAAAAPAPDLSQSLVESVRAILKAPQDAFFMQLPPDGSEITRDDIAEALGWKPDGSNIKDRISELFRLEVIVKPTTTTVARADWIRE